MQLNCIQLYVLCLVVEQVRTECFVVKSCQETFIKGVGIDSISKEIFIETLLASPGESGKRGW